jgi:predicted TIM-barrel fold metal-dependent hydrolase
MENPVDVVRRNIHISPFWEEDYAALAELLGEDNILFGSDFPHPEGLAEPAKFVEDLAHLPEEQVRKFMGGNLARLMGVGVPA